MLKAVLRDSIIYSLASVLSRGLAIILLPIYTNVLSTNEFGAYDIIITLGIFVNIVVSLEISQGLGRYWSDVSPDKQQRRSLASTSLWFCVFMYSSFATICLIAAPQLSKFIFSTGNYKSAIQLGSIFIALNGIYYLLLNQFRWELQTKAYVLASSVYALSILLFSILFCLWFDFALIGVVLAQLLAAFISCILSLWLLRRTFGWVFNLDQLCLMLRFSIPLVPAGLAILISLYANRFALNYFGNLEDVAHFGVASRISGIMMLLIMGIQMALTPLVYKNYRNPETPSNISQLFSWFTAVALIGSLFLFLFANEILSLFATSQFVAGAPLVGVLAPSLLLSQMYIFAPGMAIAKRTDLQLLVTLLSALVSVLCNWLLVPKMGVWGAAFSTLSASLTFFCLWLFLSQGLYRIPYKWKPILVSCLGFLILSYLASEINNSMLNLGAILIIKGALIILLVGVVVFSGLFPISNVKGAYLHLKSLLQYTYKSRR